MSSPFDWQHGLAGYALLTLGGFAVTEPWRWLGVRLARDLSVDSEIFRWARAVSTAIVAALVTRLLVFPTGPLAALPLWLRVAAFLCGLLGYFVFGRRLGAGVAAGSAVIMAGGLLLGN